MMKWPKLAGHANELRAEEPIATRNCEWRLTSYLTWTRRRERPSQSLRSTCQLDLGHGLCSATTRLLTTS